jgi:transmembrane protein TMEM260 (protein O-mannosyltransferase)
VVAIAFAAPLVVLLASVRTSVGFWDTGDLQTVAWIAGIPYPTGFPGYVVVGWLWTHLLPVASVAARLNALSAVAIAAAAATVAGAAQVFGVRPLIAILCGGTFAFAHTVWYRATYADVHPLGFAVAFVAIAFALRWALRRDTRALALALPLGGVALAIDNTTVLILAGGVVVALARRLPPRAVARGVGIAALIVVVAYAYLPLRSAYVSAHRLDPTLALGIPPGRPFWDDHHPATREGFRSLVAGSEWGPGETLLRLFTPDTVRVAARRYGEYLLEDETQVLLFVALVGLGFIAAQSPVIALGLVLAALVPALFGASYQAEADPSRYVLALYAVLALGAAVAAERTVRAFGRERPGAALAVVAALLAAVVVRDGVLGGDLFAQRADDAASRLGERVAASTRDGAVVVAPWDWATPLGYKAYVERRLGRRIVVCALASDHLDDYARWLHDRQVAIVSDGAPQLPGFRVRRLAGGTPQVYEILAP